VITAKPVDVFLFFQTISLIFFRSQTKTAKLRHQNTQQNDEITQLIAFAGSQARSEHHFHRFSSPLFT
jgi:hypothetical protein